MRTRFIAIVSMAALVLSFGFQSHPVFASGVVGNGTPASCTLSTLAAALSGGGSITFNCGSTPVTIAVTSTLTITAPTTIDGGGLVTLDGGNATRVIMDNSALTLQNLRIVNGYASGTNEAANGGGVGSTNYGSTLAVTNCQFLHNISAPNVTSSNAYDYGGGAIFTLGGMLTVTNSTFSGNQVTNGSGGAIHGLGANLFIDNSLLVNNQIGGSGDGNGGALYADGALHGGNGTIVFSGDIFAHNDSTSEGGAVHIHMYQANDSTLIEHSVFSDNHVYGSDAQGGGLYFGNGKLTVTGSLFVGNSVQGNSSSGDGSGGAISTPEPSVVMIANSTLVGNNAFGTSYNANGGGFYIVNNTVPFTIINSTIAYNYAGWVGGGITGGPGVLKNTIVADNSASNGSNHWGILQQCSTQLTDGGGNFQYPPKNPNTNYYNEVTCTASVAQVDPLLGTLADNSGFTRTIGLRTGSPAHGGGVAATCAAAPISGVDQRGVARGTTSCDSGAVEEVSGSIPSASDTIGIYRSGTFYLRNSNSTGNANIGATFAVGTQPAPIAGDWSGGGFDTIGLYDRASGVFYLRMSNTSGNTSTAADLTFTLGNPQDTPLAGRWVAGAATSGAGVFRPTNGILYLKNALTTGYADHAMVMGNPGDVGIAGDWTGKGFDSPGVFRPTTTVFYLSNVVSDGIIYANIGLVYGSSTDVPLAGDWIGQGHDGIGMFRPSNGNVYLRNTLTSGSPGIVFYYGAAGDQPLAGHWQPAYPALPGVPLLVQASINATAIPATPGQSVPGDNTIGG